MNARRTLACGSALAAVALALSFGAPPASAHHIDDSDLSDLELLGKNTFHDKQLSTPRGKQACASCHDPRVGWTLPLDNINKTSVGAPGAQPGAQGGRKPQNNSYVQGFLGEYTPGPLGPGTFGGAFWDGRATGCGPSNDPGCAIGTGNTTEPITPDDVDDMHTEFLGAVSEQALNPTFRGEHGVKGVEQNTREKSVCQMVKTAKYKDLFEAAWGEPIDCNQEADPDHGSQPFYHISFKKLAVAVAAYQGSADVNSFTSPRDDCIRQGGFPCDFLGDEANLGHDLFYNRNDSGLNNGGPDGSPKNAGCAGCHNTFLRPGTPNPPDPSNELEQSYSDTAYHTIGLPFNRELSRDDGPGGDVGLLAHDDLPGNIFGLGDAGLFKTAPLRNLTKNELGITKAYMHNGYFKNVADIVHYYNTRWDGTALDTIPDNPNPKTVCEVDPGIEQATAAEAIANNCWPEPEFPDTVVTVPFPILAGLFGNLGLTPDEEAALVAFLETLSDSHTPTAPSTVK